jgi:hypothetical protein
LAFRKNPVLVGSKDIIKDLVDAGVEFPCHDSINGGNNSHCNFVANAFSQHATWSYCSHDRIVNRHKGACGKVGRVNQTQRFAEGQFRGGVHGHDFIIFDVNGRFGIRDEILKPGALCPNCRSHSLFNGRGIKLGLGLYK